jgi:anti-sigma regulatory factor (Ser/Thr protein kinase)
MVQIDRKFRLHVPSSTENLALIREFVTSVGVQAGLDEVDVGNHVLAIDEAPGFEGVVARVGAIAGQIERLIHDFGIFWRQVEVEQVNVIGLEKAEGFFQLCPNVRDGVPVIPFLSLGSQDDFLPQSFFPPS